MARRNTGLGISKSGPSIHVEADHETDRVHIWTEGKSPDLRVFRERMATLGFKVTHVHTDGRQGQGKRR